MSRTPPDVRGSFADRWTAITTVTPYGSRRFIDRRGSCLNFVGNAISREPTPTQDYTRIKIGDVGFVRCGQFHLLFSAGSPLGERQLGRDVPDKFEPLNVGTPVSGEPRKPDCLRTSTVRHIGAGLGTTEFISRYVPSLGTPSTSFSKNAPPRLLERRVSFSFDLTGDCGAALVTMYPTRSEDCHEQSEREFAAYTERHYESWVDFSRRKHGGANVHPFLVSGFDMTKNFAIMAYLRDGTSQRGDFRDFPMFGSTFASFEGTWRANLTPYTNHGPHQRAIHTSPSHSEDAGSLANEYDQCVFIRYYTMRTRGWWMVFRKKLVQVDTGLRGPGSGDNRGDTSPGPTTRSSGGSSTTGGGNSLEGQKGPTTGGTDSEPDVVVQDSQDVRSLPCFLFSTLIFAFRMRDMTFGISLQITYSR